MYQITGILVTIILVMIFIYQLLREQNRAYENATGTFSQIEQVLEENQKELEEIHQEYRQTCLHNAEAVSRILEGDPDALNSVDELKEIAASVEVDEIHIFDTTGRIVTGTHPQYYNYTLDSGEQMMFFKPMLEDKTLKLVQDITPNTAEEKPMQYSAVWSSNGEFIVQVGMEPVNVMKVTEKNELSYIFSLFRVNTEADYYAIDAESGEIVGSTDLEIVGCNLSEIGFDFNDVKNDADGFHAKISGRKSFCVFKLIGSNYIGRVISIQNLYQRVPGTILLLLICLMIVAFFLAQAVIKHTNKYVVDRIHDVNEKLQSITNGNLEETVDIQSSIEFSELSDYINIMVKSILDNNKKMSYVLSKTNLYIGVYEYNEHMDKIRFTEYIPRILSLDIESMKQLSSDTRKFNDFLDKIRENPISNEESIYQNGDKYIRLEEIRNNNEVFGVVVDVTAEVMKRKEIETERDIDILTGLYNRRGLDMKLSNLFSKREELGHSAIIMIDADGLKGINDTYGHEKGDIYIKKISEIINDFGSKSSIASRQGGDEFVLFLYDYDTENELFKEIENLKYIQNNSFTQLGENLHVPVRFSFGYSITNKSQDYQSLLKDADDKMYKNKLARKKNIV